MISFLPSVNPNLIIRGSSSENISAQLDGIWQHFLYMLVVEMIYESNAFIRLSVCSNPNVWVNIFQSLNFFFFSSKIILGLVLIPPGYQLFVWAILETTGGQKYRWLLTILALNTLVFSSLYLSLSLSLSLCVCVSLSLSVWEAFEPRWVSQLPLIFPYKCGKHEPPLLSSAWACTQQND